MQVVGDVVLQFWETLVEMAPYLLFGFTVAGVLSAFLSPDLVERHLGGRGIWPIVKASLFGVPLPLCSCSVIPVAASLRRHGSSRGATAAFLLSTPQTGADSIFVTLSLLGPVFAVFRPVAAFLSGVVGGACVESFGGPIDPPPEAAPDCDACCARPATRSRWRHAARHGFVTLPRDIARPLLLGLVVAGFIAALVPANFFAETLGTGWLSMVAMLALGIPVYVCATASIPVAVAMMAKGVSPGAALVFLMTGPATNAAAIATLWKVLGHRSAIIYLLVVAATALASGFALDGVFAVTSAAAQPPAHAMLPYPLRLFLAFALLAVLLPAILHRKPKEP